MLNFIKKNKDVIILIFLILIFRYHILPFFGIVDISVIVTNSMERGKYWEESIEKSIANVPCCIVTKDPSYKNKAIGFNINNKTYIVPIFVNEKFINILSNISKNINESLGDIVFYKKDLKENKSVVVFEKNLKMATIFVKYPENMPYKKGIYRGDIVIVKKCKDVCKEIKDYDVIQYKYKGFQFVHRVIKKIYLNNNSCIFIVKGDNAPYPINPTEFLIDEKSINGKVVAVVPKIGYLNYLIYNYIIKPFYNPYLIYNQK